MTPHEQDLIDNLEANGFPDAALRLRKFISAQNRDANAGCENSGALIGDRWIDTRDGSLKEWDGRSWKPLLTPDQARYAYDQTITHHVPGLAVEAPPDAIPCDLSHARAKTDATLARRGELLVTAKALAGPKHRFIYSNGAIRTEPACR